MRNAFRCGPTSLLSNCVEPGCAETLQVLSRWVVCGGDQRGRQKSPRWKAEKRLTAAAECGRGQGSDRPQLRACVRAARRVRVSVCARACCGRTHTHARICFWCSPHMLYGSIADVRFALTMRTHTGRPHAHTPPHAQTRARIC